MGRDPVSAALTHLWSRSIPKFPSCVTYHLGWPTAGAGYDINQKGGATLWVAQGEKIEEESLGDLSSQRSPLGNHSIHS